MKINPQAPYSAEDANTIIKTKYGSKQWVRDLASDYDLCMVFPSLNDAGVELNEKGVQCMAKLHEHAFETFTYIGNDKEKSIFVLLRAPLDKLRAFADINNFSFLLDPVVAKAKLEAGNPSKNIAGVYLEHQPDITELEPFSNLYGEYSRLVDESLFFRESDRHAHPFSRSIRLKLSVLILQSRPSPSSDALKLKRFMKEGIIKACFPLHAPYTIDTFRAQWMSYPFASIPLEDVKNYFGEEIGLYYAFINHYNTYLLPVAIVGVAFQVAIWYLNDYSAPFVPFYSIILALWAVVMLEYWKRKEKYTAFRWGTTNYESNETDRSEFRGEQTNSVINGSKIRYFSSSKRQSLLRQSYSIILLLIFMVAAVTGGIYFGRFYIHNMVGAGNAALAASIANALSIQFFNWLYNIIAVSLNDRENHRTDSAYAENMVVKIFLFQFVNSYASFYYVAFAARYAGDCEPRACITALATNLATLYISQVFVGNVLELLIPYLTFKYKYHTYIKKNVDKISRPEVEFLLEPYDLMDSSLQDYSEVVIRFGFKALFATALPLTSFFALISNYVEVRCDGWKMMNVHQRPFPQGAQDIGAWQGILTVLVTIAVITNAGLIVFALDIFPKGYSTAFQYWVFILFQWILFFLQGAIMAAIPDVPEEIEIQNQRCAFIVEKLIEQVADDNDADFVPPEGDILQLQAYPLGGGFFK